MNNELFYFGACGFVVCATLGYYSLRRHLRSHKLLHKLPIIEQSLQDFDTTLSEAERSAGDLESATAHQAHDIASVATSVAALYGAIEQGSNRAGASVAVALESVTIAAEGGIVARSTISGMERIQSQIQETSNHMRRLSDSSQEIGEMVLLIDGIADQTNILSLNAAIQAAMAGEAGRGFAVVADEIQRLSEKVSYATKEIGSLVRSIQTDTNQVITAMDQTKTQVLEGVQAAQGAGTTLEKIEKVSRQLSDLIHAMAGSASDQLRASGTISHSLHDLRSLSEQTAVGGRATGEVINHLQDLVENFHQLIAEMLQTRL